MAAAHVVFLFHQAAEHRVVPKPPKPGTRVSGDRGESWIVHDVFQSGVNTYTATCIAPGEIKNVTGRVSAYLRRDWDFFSAVLLITIAITLLVAYVTAVWLSPLVGVAVSALLVFVWLTK